MLGATSLLKGEYTPVTRSKPRRRLSRNRDTVVARMDTVSMEPSASADCSDDWGTSTSDTFSTGGSSTCAGDSFVLAIDWEQTTSTVGPRYYHDFQPLHDNVDNSVHNGLNDSLEDPYLMPTESIRQRLFHKNHRGNHSTSNQKAKPRASLEPPLGSFTPHSRSTTPRNAHTLHPTSIRSVRKLLAGSSASKSRRTVECRSTPSTPMPATMPAVLDTTSAPTSVVKSLGSFAMPPAVVECVAIPNLDTPLRRPKAISSCLGSFDFPPVHAGVSNAATEVDDDGFLTALENEPTDHALSTVRVPLLARFEASNLSIVRTASTSSDEPSPERSFLIPHRPVLTQPPTPSRQRHRMTRQRIVELKAQLDADKRLVTAPGATVTLVRTKRGQMARHYLDVGTLQQQLHQYPAAINSFFHAAAMFRHLVRPVALATALDHVAVAYCHAHEEGSTASIHRQHKVSRFFRCLYEALELRKQEVGPWHVDTVDTLQHLAQLFLLTGQAAEAARHYLEVVQLRKVIFGPCHAGTAVTAHCLGNAYFQSHDTVAAEVWYEYAWNVYQGMELPLDNPAVAKLARDRKRLERVDRWITEEDPADDENLLFEL